SWCQYRKAEADNNLKDFQHPPALDDTVQALLKPIYENLTSNDLLERCVGANTQNNNESYNACVWHLAPKHIFSGKQIIEIAAYCAACKFNDGFKPLIKIMETMGVTIGKISTEFAEKCDEARIEKTNLCSTSDSKESRSALRNARFEENEAYEQAEGVMYGPGIAD
ncbi:hypothetical protein ALC57_00024, partial [Trachymyrmex cornetzi]